MPRVQLPPGCAGFADGNTKYMAERGAGELRQHRRHRSRGQRALKKLKAQDYASAGLVDAGPEKFFVKQGPEGRWCPGCRTIWHSWTKCAPVRPGDDPRVEMSRDYPRAVHALRASGCADANNFPRATSAK